MESLETLPPLDLNLNLMKTNSAKILEFSKLKREIGPLVRILQTEPQTELEKKILLDEDDASEVEDPEDFDILIQKSRVLLEELRAKWEAQKEVEKALWDTVVSNRELFSMKENPSLEFCNARKDLIESLQKVIHVQEAAQVKKNSWISKNIIEIRKELVETWNQCMVNSDEANFKAFTAINFSEELLELHKLELDKWKAYHSKNQLLFDQIEKRAVLWEQMKDLQAKSDDPNRFVNRGGVLLKSQKEMNYVNKTLPKVEEKLKSLATTFEKENGRKLLLCGKPILKKIEDDWREYKDSIFKRKAAAKINVSHSGPDNPLSIGLRSASQNNLSKSRKDISELGLRTGEKRITIRPAPACIKRFRLNEEFSNVENCQEL